MNDVELSGLDRSTLRLWRVSNLVGWGALGAVGAMATSLLTFRIWAGAIPLRGMASSILAVALSTALAALVNGLVVGDHVYRWPGWVAALGFLVPAMLAVLVTAVGMGLVEVLVVFIAPAIAACLAALVARWRFRQRPRALRAPAAR